MFTFTGGQYGGQAVTALTTMPFFIHSKFHSKFPMSRDIRIDETVGSK